MRIHLINLSGIHAYFSWQARKSHEQYIAVASTWFCILYRKLVDGRIQIGYGFQVWLMTRGPQRLGICDRIWENPPYAIRVRFAQCAFLVAQVQIYQSPDFVISMSNNPSFNCSISKKRLSLSRSKFDPRLIFMFISNGSTHVHLIDFRYTHSIRKPHTRA